MNKHPSAPSDRRDITTSDRGRPSASELSDEEIAFFEETMALANPTPEEEAGFAEYVRRHGSSGVDDQGRLVKRDAAGNIIVIAERLDDE